MTGKVIAHYDVLEKLGEGGMGVVYKARDKRLNRFVALKLLPSDKLGDEDRIRRFTQEARTASALNHPNIITIHDIGSEAGFHYIVMEYLAGKTLDQLIPRKGMRLAEVLKIGVQIADALAAAGNAGVIHRDVKPGNVMVSESGHVKVLDFGLSKLSELAASPEQATATMALSEEERPRTREGTVVGTVAYMSPEQAQGKPLDPRTDIFSFGALLYEMTTGQRAFRGDNTMSTISAILRDNPKPAGQLSDDVPRDLDQIINRCLRKDPDRRFQHMADARVALLELKEEAESGKVGAIAGAVRRPWWRPWILPACAVILLTVLGIGFRSRLRRPGDELAPRTIPFTVYTGAQGAPAFSPDGNQIAFPWTGDQGEISHIYVKMIGTETPLRITSGGLSDTAPGWSPDGTAVALVRALPSDSSGIYQVSPLGGAERRIAEIARGLRTRVNWSRDGKWLVASGREAPGKASRIFVISADTGEKRALSFGRALDEESPALAPYARALVFNRLLSDLVTGLFVVDLDERLQPRGEPRQLHTATGSGTFLNAAWTPDSKEIVFSSSGQFWRVTAMGQARPRQVPISGQNANYPAIAPRGNRMAFQSGFIDVNIWSFPVTGLGKAGDAAQLIASTRTDVVRQNAFSPDGRRIAFESNRSGPMAVWLADVDGSKPNCVFGCAGSGFMGGSPAWSPDGKWIAFDSRKDGNPEVYVISAEGGAPRRMTTHPGDDLIPVWSHDGQWIYFESNRTGRFEIFKMPSGSGDHPIQITQHGGWAPQESADGKFLYFTRSRASFQLLFTTDKQPLLRIPVEGGEEEQVVELVCDRSWALAAQGVWFTWPTGPARTELRFFDTATRKVTTAAGVAKPAWTGVALSPDGRTLVYNQIDQQRTEINLVENFK